MEKLFSTAAFALSCALALTSISAEARPARMSDSNNLKQIGVASHGECTNNLKQLGLGAEAAAAECRSLARRQARSSAATQADVSRLKKIRPQPAVKCARIEYVYQCLSSQNMNLSRANCRAGQTEAQCCQAMRNSVHSRICGPLWDRLKKAGKTYYPGIWLCKCIERPRRLKLERTPIRPR